jgi:Immunity protein 42
LIIGNPSVFAIESSIVQAYERLSSRALGFFVVYVGGRCYGRRSPDATMLACSHNEVERRIAQRGSHTASFASEEAGKIADAFRNAFYAEKHQESYFGISRLAFREMIQSGRIVWAPDGDEAFDDGSYVLQFDLRERVRLIAFKCGQSYVHDAATLTDVWLPADDFYSALQRWHNPFEAEWTSMPKKSDSEASLLTRATMNNLHTTVASVLPLHRQRRPHPRTRRTSHQRPVLAQALSLRKQLRKPRPASHRELELLHRRTDCQHRLRSRAPA